MPRRRRAPAGDRLRHRRGDTAAGAGGGERGRVVAVDISEPMLEVARQHVAESGLRNVTLLLGDAQLFAFEQAAFDIATSRMGVMFFADPLTAFRNIRGALKPDGRLVFACWAPLAENRHWLISYEIAVRLLGPAATSPEHEAGPLAFGNPDYVRRILAGAGFADISIERAHPTIIGGSAEEEARQALMMGPTARLIETKNPPKRSGRRSLTRLQRPSPRWPAPDRSGCRPPSFWSRHASRGGKQMALEVRRIVEDALALPASS